jgi:hypothetical protein
MYSLLAGLKTCALLSTGTLPTPIRAKCWWFASNWRTDWWRCAGVGGFWRRLAQQASAAARPAAVNPTDVSANTGAMASTRAPPLSRGNRRPRAPTHGLDTTRHTSSAGKSRHSARSREWQAGRTPERAISAPVAGLAAAAHCNAGRWMHPPPARQRAPAFRYIFNS